MQPLRFTLKQHTPLIHFQHDQDEATLRASEVKPRLDRFLLTRLGNGDYNNGKQQAKAKGWLVGKGDHPALDYRMKIKTPEVYTSDDDRWPMFFGNMGDNEKKPKGISFCPWEKSIELIIYCNNNDLRKNIEDNKRLFFFLHNFGTRQSKGYGSFYLDGLDKESFKRNDPFSGMGVEYYYFDLDIIPFEKKQPEKNVFQVRNVLKDIDLFYKTLRSGINQQGSYFKSMMYFYAKEKGEGAPASYWDKRAIRSHFQLFANSYNKKPLYGSWLKVRKAELDYGEKFDSQESENNNKSKEFGSDPSQVRLYRDVLGLSSIQDWGFYGAKISKTNSTIERMGSPLLIKPIKMGDKNYRVYVIPRPIPVGFFDQSFDITVSYESSDKSIGRNLEKTSIKTPASFSVSKYLEFVFQNEKGKKIAQGQIEKMPDEITYHDRRNNQNKKSKNNIKKTLSDIFNTIKFIPR